MDKKKKVIILISVILFILLVMLIQYINKGKVFIRLVDDVSTNLVEKLNYDTFSGDIELNINVNSLYTKNKIINDMKYEGKYQIDSKNRFIDIDGSFVYDKQKFKNNTYIKDNKVYVLVDDIYDKYIKFDFLYLTFLSSSKESRNIISTFNDEFGKLSKKKNYKFSKGKFKGEKVNKITLDLTGKNNLELKKELTKNLVKNKEFVYDLGKYKNFSDKTTIKYIKNFKNKYYKFILYTSRFKNEFVGLKIIHNEEEFIINKKDNKYYFEYSLRGGLMRRGYFEVDDGKITKFNLEELLESIIINVDIKELSVKYNKKIKVEEKVTFDNSIRYSRMSNQDKEKIKNKEIMKKIIKDYEKAFEEVDEYIPPQNEESFKEPSI